MTHKPDFSQFLKVLNLEQPDYVPFYEHLTDISIMEKVLNKPRPGATSAQKQKEKLMRFYLEFYSTMGFDCLPLEFGLNLFFLGGNVGGGRSWLDHERATISDMEEFHEYVWPSLEEAIDFEAVDFIGKILPEGMKLVTGVAGGIQEHCIRMLGLIPLSVALRRNPELVEAVFEKIGKLILEVDKILVENDFVGALRMGDDMGYKTRTILNPKTVRRYVLPKQKDLVDIAHKHGKPFILHSCGNLHEILDELIDYVKIDALHSFQDLILPVQDAKKLYGKRVALLGGVDLDKLCRYDSNPLEAYCKAILDSCKVGGGYAFGTGNSVADYVPVENYLRMLEFGKKYGTY